MDRHTHQETLLQRANPVSATVPAPAAAREETTDQAPGDVRTRDSPAVYARWRRTRGQGLPQLADVKGGTNRIVSSDRRHKPRDGSACNDPMRERSSVAAISPDIDRRPYSFTALWISKTRRVPDQHHCLVDRVSARLSREQVCVPTPTPLDGRRNTLRLFEEVNKLRGLLRDAVGVKPPKTHIHESLLAKAPSIAFEVLTEVQLRNRFIDCEGAACLRIDRNSTSCAAMTGLDEVAFFISRATGQKWPPAPTSNLARIVSFTIHSAPSRRMVAIGWPSSSRAFERFSR